MLQFTLPRTTDVRANAPVYRSVMPPDILLIILDTLRRDRLSIYGHERATSPGFDEFAARSTLFERAIAPSQWTIPAHSSIFTGLYPTAHGVVEANSQLSPAHP